MTRLQKEKGYRLGGFLPGWDDKGNRIRVIRLIRLPHKGVGRHQIVTDEDYTKRSKIRLDIDVLEKAKC